MFALQLLPLGVVQRNRRSAERAGIGLGMEAPIQGIEIFPTAVVAHIEEFHRGFGTVVGNGLDDRKSRPAIGTVYKRIAKSPIGRVGQFFETIFAQRNIRRDICLGGVGCLAGDNGERALLQRVFQGTMGERVDPGKRWGFGAERVDKGGDLWSGGPDNDPFAGVCDGARNGKTGGEFKNEGPKPNALDSAPDENFDPVFY